MQKNRLFKILIGAFFGSILLACDSKTSAKLNDSEKPSANQKVGKILPFKVCRIINNHLFKNGFSVLDADIKIEGGQSNDWVATGIAVAKELGKLGISTDVKLTIYRSDLGELDNKRTPNGYKWLTRIDYGVDPNRSMNTSNGDKQWLISYATNKSVATPEKIRIDQDFHALDDKYGNPANDEKIVAAIKKKYHLIGEFNLHRGNLSGNTNEPGDYFIDAAGQEDKLKKLKSDFKQLPENRAFNDIECST